jgi:outer membrane protein OmpA-like peptidoglycan-associated protein
MMRRINWIMLSIVSLALLTAGVGLAEKGDAPNAKDHPLFNRMPGFYIHQYEEKEFDSHTFVVDNKSVRVEGHFYHILYFLRSGQTEPSRIQILRNYENATTKIGGTVLASNYDGSSYMKLVRDGKEIWARVTGIGSEYHLYIIEKGAMAQEIVANAGVFSNDIKTTGHAAIYGIYFDTGKSVIKPESEAALGEIVKLLKGDTGLRLYVVGHTDSVGSIDSNMRLSQDRANAVVQALVGKYAIATTRLKAYGVGPLAPVASNDTEVGKAKNRRVELVKQ